MTTNRDVFEYLCRLAPLELQLDFDNSGFLTGRRDAEAGKMLLALDITDAVIEEAEEKGARLIVSHHPLIFTPLRSVADDPAGRKILRLAELGIAAICMHTNLDVASGGVNDVLMTVLGGTVEDVLDRDNCGRIGRLPSPMPMTDFLARCKTVLGSKGLRYVSSGKDVYRLAVLGGSGGDALRNAAEKGCDTFVTADVKYHQFLEAAELGINLIDADHFCTENPVMPVLAQKLRDRFPETEVLLSESHRQIVSFC